MILDTGSDKKLYKKQSITTVLAISNNTDEYKDITNITYTNFNNNMYTQLKDNTCVILDDADNLQDKFIQDLFTYRKQHKFICIVACQYLLDIKPNIRNYFDGVYMFTESNINNIKRMYDCFGNSAIKKFETFKVLMNNLQILNHSDVNNISPGALLLHGTQAYIVEIPKTVSTLIPSFVLETTKSEELQTKQYNPIVSQINLVIQGNCEIIKQLAQIDCTDKISVLRVISEYNYKLSNLLLEI